MICGASTPPTLVPDILYDRLVGLIPLHTSLGRLASRASGVLTVPFRLSGSVVRVRSEVLRIAGFGVVLLLYRCA